jgi:hypothetical protein
MTNGIRGPASRVRRSPVAPPVRRVAPPARATVCPPRQNARRSGRWPGNAGESRRGRGEMVPRAGEFHGCGGGSCDGSAEDLGPMAVPIRSAARSLPATDNRVATAAKRWAGRGGHVQLAGDDVGVVGDRVAPGGRHLSPAGNPFALAGRHLPPAGRPSAPAGHEILAAARRSAPRETASRRRSGAARRRKTDCRRRRDPPLRGAAAYRGGETLSVSFGPLRHSGATLLVGGETLRVCRGPLGRPARHFCRRRSAPARRQGDLSLRWTVPACRADPPATLPPPRHRRTPRQRQRRRPPHQDR